MSKYYVDIVTLNTIQNNIGRFYIDTVYRQTLDLSVSKLLGIK